MRGLFQSLSRAFGKKTTPVQVMRSPEGRLSLGVLKGDEISNIEKWFSNRKTCELAFGIKASWEILEPIRNEYLEELRADHSGVLGIYLTSGDLIGFVRYKLFQKGLKKRARVGIVIGKAEARGQGLGQEAFRTLLTYLFEKRQVRLIELDTASFNNKAQECFLACGFEALRETDFVGINSEWKEKRLLMQLSYENWQGSRA